MALRYIAVNLKYEAIGVDCACCKLPIKKMYVRDFDTDLLYHNPWCYETHILTAMKAIGGDSHVEFYR